MPDYDGYEGWARIPWVPLEVNEGNAARRIQCGLERRGRRDIDMCVGGRGTHSGRHRHPTHPKLGAPPGEHSGQRARKRPAGSGRAQPSHPPAAALRRPHLLILTNLHRRMCAQLWRHVRPGVGHHASQGSRRGRRPALHARARQASRSTRRGRSPLGWISYGSCLAFGASRSAGARGLSDMQASLTTTTRPTRRRRGCATWPESPHCGSPAT